MKLTRWSLLAIACLTLSLVSSAASFADEEANPELVQLVIGLLADPDKDLRALGFEQVRTAAKGAAATRQFAAQLPKLPPDAQVGLLSALADRGDPAARPAVLEMLDTSREEPVRVAAIIALAPLGEPADANRLMELLSAESATEQEAARDSLIRLSGERVPADIAAGLTQGEPPLRVTLIEILAERRALDLVPAILTAATDDEASVRAAAMTALGQLAGPEHMSGMVQGVLKAELGAERAAAEKSIQSVCGRIDADKRAEPLLAAMDQLDPADRMALLPTLGRVGGVAALSIIEEAISNPDAAMHETGILALCNWPEASIAPRLIELVQADEHSEHRAMALRALIRVAPLPDGRSNDQRLALVQQALAFCTRDEERNLLLGRAHAVRTVEALRFLTPFMDQPSLAQQACLSTVELAHHRELRDANKAEFHAALDKVIQTSQDATVIDRANRYKNGQTWVRPSSIKRK